MASLSRKDLDDLTSFGADFGAKGLAWVKIKADGEWQSPIAKFFTPGHQDTINQRLEAEEGDILFFGADVRRGGTGSPGQAPPGAGPPL